VELDQWSNPKPPLEECACGCGTVGRQRARAWLDGLPPHVKRCPCRRCSAPRFKTNASRRERKVAKAVGGRRNIGSGAFGGSDVVGGIVNIEETAQESLVRGLRRWWGTKAMQTKTARLLEQRLIPNAFVASWDGKARLVVMEWDDFKNLCQQIQDAA
jgi:hypothetical protein